MLHAGDVRDEFDKAGRGRDGCAVRGPHHMLFPFRCAGLLFEAGTMVDMSCNWEEPRNI